MHGAHQALLFCKERCERIALIALYKRVTRPNCSSHSLKKSNFNDALVICSFPLKKRAIALWKRANHYVALSLTENERFAQKTKSKFLTLDYNVDLISPYYAKLISPVLCGSNISCIMQNRYILYFVDL